VGAENIKTHLDIANSRCVGAPIFVQELEDSNGDDLAGLPKVPVELGEKKPKV